MQRLSFVTAVAWIAPASIANAQSPAPPPIRPLGPIIARAKVPFTAVAAIRVLSDGRVIVDDPRSRHLLLLDSSLATASTILDTLSTSARIYPPKRGDLVAYAGDSSLFLDPMSLSYLVIAPDGHIGRVIAAPAQMIGNRDGPIAVAAGYTYWGLWLNPPDQPPLAPDQPVRAIPDSGMVLRVALDGHTVDTAAYFVTPQAYPMAMVADSTGWLWRERTVNPLPDADDYLVLRDGTIVVARGHDYRLIFVGLNGRRDSTARLPHTWTRLSDSAKVAFMDSVRLHYQDPQFQSRQTSNRNGETRTRTAPPRLVDPSELPDYLPAFADIRGEDANGNIWIREATGSVFDVVDRKGEMIDRVEIPGGTQLLGWGPGVVYLSSRDGTGTSLVRARIH